MNIDCLLLAGGSSQRMGEPKMLLPLNGGSLFEHVLAQHLGSCLRQICAVIPGWVDGFGPYVERWASDRLEFVSLNLECVMSDSLKTGWRHLTERWRPDAVMISLADKPLVTSDIIDSVIDAYTRSGRKICVPVFGGDWGHPVVMSAALESEVYDLRGDCGARSIIEAQRDRVCEVIVHSDAVLVDVDTHGDFEELKERLAREAGRREERDI
jgi:molybdenum cofactor cytidylyltransferase